MFWASESPWAECVKAAKVYICHNGSQCHPHYNVTAHPDSPQDQHWVEFTQRYTHNESMEGMAAGWGSAPLLNWYCTFLSSITLHRLADNRLQSTLLGNTNLIWLPPLPLVGLTHEAQSSYGLRKQPRLFKTVKDHLCAWCQCSRGCSGLSFNNSINRIYVHRPNYQ